MATFSLDFPYAYGKPAASARLKVKPEDFRVDEIYDFSPSGDGEHFYLQIRKTGENTQYIADKLASYFDIKKMDVGYSGMKDRQAITSQWFSCYLPNKKSFDEEKFIHESELNVEVITQAWHKQKLRRGTHQANRFEILLRDLQQDDETEARLVTLRERGAPNYFGEQRFGREAQNLYNFADHIERSQSDYAQAQNAPQNPRRKKTRKIPVIWQSAARSWLFNLQLSERVKQNTWSQIIDGDVVEQDYSGKEFATAALWGRGRNSAQGMALQTEEKALEAWLSWREKLEHSGLSQERRVLQLHPQHFQWAWEASGLRLKFDLGPGQFATALLRELAQL